jgi:biotin transport system substrate-specific component
MKSLAHKGLLWREAVVGQILSVMAFVVLLSFAALIRIPLPFTPVPVTMQNFVVFAGAALLGPRVAMASVLAYLGLGAAGLPVFSGWGAGAAYLLGPTGGYLVGFMAAAWVVPALCRSHRGKNMGIFALAMVSGVAATYLCGAAWLYFFYGWEPRSIWLLGVAPFVMPDLLKAICAAAVARKYS